MDLDSGNVILNSATLSCAILPVSLAEFLENLEYFHLQPKLVSESYLQNIKYYTNLSYYILFSLVIISKSPT